MTTRYKSNSELVFSVSDSIIKQEFPENFQNYQLEKINVLEAIYLQQVRNNNQNVNQRGTFFDLVSGLAEGWKEWVPVLYATGNIIYIFLRMAMKPTKEKLKFEFAKELESQGIGKEKASEISEKYLPSLWSVLENKFKK